MRRRAAALVAALWCGAATAQALPPNVAVPFYTAAHFMKGLHRHWMLPRATDFAAEAAALPPAIESVCAGGGEAPLREARLRWQATAIAWDTLSAVAIGPLLQRRSLRQIDFMPTRPELIARAIRAAPADAKSMERIGTPAKGLPALEWLLWTQPVAPGTPACRYGVQVAAEIDAEGKALAQAFGELAARDWGADEAAASAAMAEALNQWVGGLERLRWTRMEKPLKSAGGKPPAFPRAASGSTHRSWAAQWQGLQTMGVPLGQQVPAPGEELVPLETYLRGRGLNPLAGRLAGAARQVSRHLEAAAPVDTQRTLQATRSLASLKRLAQAEVAAAPQHGSRRRGKRLKAAAGSAY